MDAYRLFEGPDRRHHEPAGEALSRPTTEREAEMMDDGLQPSRAPGVGGGEVRFEPLGKNLRPAFWSDASEPADADPDDDVLPSGSSFRGQRVERQPLVAALAARSLSNLTPADVYFGRCEGILAERERIKRQILMDRRLRHHAQAA
jgi:hypothetical protein